MTWRCPRCGATNEDDWATCFNDGTPRPRGFSPGSKKTVWTKLADTAEASLHAVRIPKGIKRPKKPTVSTVPPSGGLAGPSATITFNIGGPSGPRPTPQSPCPVCGIYPVEPGKGVCKNCAAKGYYLPPPPPPPKPPLVGAGALIGGVNRLFGKFIGFGKNKVMDNLLMSAIFFILGIVFVMLFNLIWLGLAFLLLGFYIWIPGEKQIKIKQIRQLQKELDAKWLTDKEMEAGITSGGLGLLAFKAFLEIMIIIFFAFQLTSIHPFVAMIALFVGYFILPTSYSSDRPYEAMRAWFRFLLGFFLPLYIWSVFTGNAALFTDPIVAVTTLLNPGVWFQALFPAFATAGIFTAVGANITGPAAAASALVWIALAFFTVFPDRIPAEQHGGTSVWIVTKSGGPIRTDQILGATKGIGNILFIVFFLVGAMQVILFLSGSLQMIMLVILGMSGFMGIVAGREGRPYVGAMVMFFSLFAFSFAFTGIVGQAAFGMWWPTVYQYGSAVVTPLTSSFDSMQQSVSDAWLLVTCPSCYQQVIANRERLRSKPIETVKSIELEEFRVLNYPNANPEVDPTMPIVMQVQLKNQGAFTADVLEINLKNPQLKDPTKVGSHYSPSEIYQNLPDGCALTACTGGNDATKRDNYCAWSDPTFPDDTRLFTFVCPADYQAWALNGINKCQCRDSEKGTVIREASCDSSDSCGDAIKIYNYGGWFLSLGFNYSFSYNSNVSTPVNVMNTSVFLQKSANKEITVKEQQTQYQGGPVMAAIWVQSQPLRSSETSFARASITNTGKGIVKRNSMFVIKIPIGDPQSLVGPPIKVSKTSNFDCTEPEVSSITAAASADYYVVNCVLSSDLATNDYATYSFRFTYDIPNEVPDKSFVFVGTVNYNYSTEALSELPIEKSPLGQ